MESCSDYSTSTADEDTPDEDLMLDEIAGFVKRKVKVGDRPCKKKMKTEEPGCDDNDVLDNAAKQEIVEVIPDGIVYPDDEDRHLLPPDYSTEYPPIW